MKCWKRVLPLLLVFAMLTGMVLPVAAEAYDTISLNETVSVEEEKVFAFVPEEDGLYAFSSTDYDGDPYGSVYDVYMHQLVHNDDGGEDWNFRAVWYATAGQTYYLEASGYGTYKVSVERAIYDSISLNETVSIEASKQFTFVPETDGVYVFSSQNSDGDPRCYIFDMYMNELAYDDDDGEDLEFKAIWYAEAGETYLLDVVGNGACEVRLTEGALAESMTLNRTSFTGDLKVNSYVALIPEFYPENTYYLSMTWSSSDETVATVDDEGYVELVGLGTAVITATTDHGLQASCTVTADEVGTIALGETKTLDAVNDRATYAYTPTEDGWYRFISKGDLDPAAEVYDQELNQIAGDDDSGENTNFVTDCFMSAGQTYYLFTRLCSLVEEGTYQVQLIKSTEPTGIAFEHDFRSGIAGEYLSVFCNPVPEDAYQENITWQISDETVAMISDTWKGNLTLLLLRAGTVTVTATTDSGFTATCTVRVNETKDINCGDSVTVYAENGHQRFRFVPEESGWYIFSSDGGVQGVGGYIFDSYMKGIGEGESDDNGYFKLKAWMEAGEEYYLGTDRYEGNPSGAYVLHLEKAVTATGIQISQAAVTGGLGEYVQLYVTLVPQNALDEEITWESSDYDVADVDSNGYVSLIGLGTAVITATSESGLSASCTVTVQIPAAQQLQCNQPVTVTETENLTWFSFVPQTSGWYRFFTQGDNMDPRGDLFDTAGNELASADDNAEDYHFSLGYEMTAGQTYYLRLKFYNTDGDDACILTAEKMVQPTGISLNYDTYAGYENSYVVLNASIAPSNGIETVTWSSSDESVAKVDEYGEVWLVSLGTATITATTVNGLQAACVISVVEPETIHVGDTVTMDGETMEVRFRFVPQADGWYGFYTTGDYDTCGVLYDAEIEYYISDDDSGPVYNYLLRGELVAGQEYTVVSTLYGPNSLRPGTYELHVEKLQKAQQLAVGASHITIYEDFYIYLDCAFLPLPSHLEEITWTSSDESVAYVDGDDYAYGAAPGTAVLNGTSESGLTTTVTMEVLARPEDAEVVGQCGYNLLWYVKDGLLTVIGSGDMFDEYEFGGDFTQVQFPETMTSIAGYAFFRQNLESVTIPASVTRIGYEAFSECNIGQIRFQGSAPEIAEDALIGVTTTAYYPAGDPSWTQAVRQDYGGDITWVAYGSGETTGTTLSGSFTTGAEGNVTLELVGTGTSVRTVVSGKTGTYSFENVATGTYTLRVTKANHVTREYTVTVGSNPVTQDVKICLLGDVDGNGRINVGDISKLLSHIRGTALITDAYLLECANANGGRLNMGDISAIYSHLKGTKPLC